MSLFKRVIPVLFYKDSLLIRSKNFYLHQNIGNFLNQTNRFFDWDVDELIYINLGKNNIQKEKKHFTNLSDCL
jgi:cyclase